MTRFPFARPLGFGLGLAILAGIALSSPAGATAAVCSIKQTADGFAALRQQPARDGRLIRRMPAGHTVEMHHASPGRPSRQGSWVRVTHWADGELHARGDARFGTGRTGWVHQGLLDDCG
ncbi:SH3 domain-containing protein [Phreatobacter sp.]|uniref:SH3 domain-containing protein n=1 Tax=Phreatobacter sp. TaxID=1966341 RepID=UPI003F72A7B8